MAKEIYIVEVETIAGVEHQEVVKLTDICALFVTTLDVVHTTMYMGVSGTVNLLAGGSTASSHHVKVNGTATINFDSLPENSLITLMVEQDSTGGYAVTLPAFDNLDTQPTVTTTASKMDVITFMKMSSGIHLHAYIKPTTTF